MTATRPILILQLRPEDETADSEYDCFLKYGGLRTEDTRRIRIEKLGIPDDLDLDGYSAIIVGGSPFDISTPEDKKSQIQNKIESDFNKLLEQVVSRDIPFLGACSGNGLLGNYLGTSISTKYREAVGCVTLDITEDGKQDPLLAGFPEQIDVLLGHKEAVDTTPVAFAQYKCFASAKTSMQPSSTPKPTPMNSHCASTFTIITAISNRTKPMS
jgi:GMP synthase (glutamine-hydrolysing)